ncbi:MAG: cytochrome c [Deltaproteobacteria bacterium]|jgi:cytochrome c1|nr:cytochrome c [Deltaproteobacteria bacterium]
MKKVLFLAVFAMIALTGVYTVITLYDSTMKVGRMNQTPVLRPHEEPLLVMDKRLVAFHKSEKLMKEKLMKENYKNMFPEMPTGSLKASLTKGEKDYQTFCSHCHGVNLDGLGTVGQSFFPLPANLTGKKVSDLRDKEIFSVISYGSEKTPALASSMTVESRNAVILYVRSMQKNAH